LILRSREGVMVIRRKKNPKVELTDLKELRKRVKEIKKRKEKMYKRFKNHSDKRR
jgi:predicted peroxiredoxin